MVSNFGDYGEIHAHARAKMGCREDSKLEFSAPLLGASRIRVFGALSRGASPRGSPFLRARVYFAGIAKIRDYSQSTKKSCSAQSFVSESWNVKQTCSGIRRSIDLQTLTCDKCRLPKKSSAILLEMGLRLDRYFFHRLVI